MNQIKISEVYKIDCEGQVQKKITLQRIVVT